MEFKEMYAKTIDRPIDPVVKADSEQHLANELEEYVITPEIKGHLLRFFDEYNDVDATGNGAWISGFFGSGKSHMLKILAVLLEDREVEGKRSYDYILPKVEDDASLRGAMELARAKHPSESILFNIDSVAPNQGRTEAGALLAAFIKTFNAHLGYFDGDQQHIAKLEYDLDQNGRFEKFKDEIAKNCEKPWEAIRKSAALYTRKIDAAFDVACDNEPNTTENIIRYYKDTYRPSIQDFARTVKEYIDTKEPGFRLNFFVDEVGQFIAQNQDLMVNLQTVAENLNEQCDGASWVLVTSQENVEDIVGEMSNNSANDFSKIQARFKVKIQLTSKDAQTVIKERLLKKKDEVIPVLDSMYYRYRDDFRVLFDFPNGLKTYRIYADESDFMETYPFVPYQFDLFIAAMRGLSDHNGFTGRHHSTGARSMLGVFQDVATRMANGLGGLAPATTEEEILASFDMMFEGLRNSLKSEVYGQITLAENLLSNPTAIRLLKALLLVKYCNDFEATPSNLRVLLYGSFRENTSVLEREIKETLTYLEKEVYIRRNNDVYEYLTDDEKDIEDEIRNTQIFTSDIEGEIADLVRECIGPVRVTYHNGGFEHTYSFNLKVDGNSQGQKRNDLIVDLITMYQNSGVFDIVPTPPKTLSVALVNADSFLNDLRIYKQTEKYANLQSGNGGIRAEILSHKRQANQTLYARLRQDFEALLSEARYNAGGSDITETLSGTGKDILESGMLELIKRSYTGLQQLKSRITDNDIYMSCMQIKDPEELPEYAFTVLNEICLLSSAGAVTIGGEGTGSLMARFSKGIYGWPEIAVRSAIALLYTAKKVEVRKGDSLVEGANLANALKKNQDMDKLVVSRMAEIDPITLTRIITCYHEVVGTNPSENEAKSIAAELSKHLDNVAANMREALNSVSGYPFYQNYKESITLLDDTVRAINADWSWVSSVFPQKANCIAKAINDLNGMRNFANGSAMEKKWKEIRLFLQQGLVEAEALGMKGDLPEGMVEMANALVIDPECYKSSDIARVSSQIKRSLDDISKAKSDLKEDQLDQLQARKSEFEATEDFKRISDEKKKELDDIFEKAKESLEDLSSVFTIKNFVDNFMDENKSKIASLLIVEKAQPESGGETPSQPHSQPVSLRDIASKVEGSPLLRSIHDVEEYITKLKTALLKEIESGNVVMK